MAHPQRQFNLSDRICMTANNALQTLFGKAQLTDRTNPAENQPAHELSDSEQKHIAGLMRINHCGEVCAQALYQGQALTAKLPEVREKMEQAAIEENDHLDWCQSRLKELNSHPSLLNPFWYLSSFAIGATAGLAGDKWSLGFVAETEHQVVRHLDNHLGQLPEHDHKSRAILEQMKIDEQQHATIALEAGGADLPYPIKTGMKYMAKVMTATVYHI